MSNPSSRKTSKFTLSLAAAAALLGVGLLGYQLTVADLPQAVAADEGVTGKAPEIALDILDGGKYKLSEDTNKVVVIDFWATWCGPCVRGLPKLQETADWAKKENLKVSFYPTNLQETPDEVREFWKAKKLTMPVLMDTKGAVAQAYKVKGIPTTVLIVNGNIAKTVVGLMGPKQDEEFRKAIKEAVEKVAAAEKAKSEKSDK